MENNKKPGIYDPEEDISSHYVALPEETSDLFPIVRQTRITLFSLVRKTMEYYRTAHAKYNVAHDHYTQFMTNVPKQEKNPLGLVVVGVAGMTGTLTYPRRPIFRSLVVVPAMIAASAVVCFPKTSKYIVQTGLSHSGSDIVVDDIIDPSLPSLPSLSSISDTVTSGFDQLKDLLAPPPQPDTASDTDTHADNINSSNNTSVGASEVSAENEDDDGVVGQSFEDFKAAGEASDNESGSTNTSTSTANDSQNEQDFDELTELGEDDASNTSSNRSDDVVLVVDSSEQQHVTEPTGDYGQSHPDDLKEYARS